jgi:hypothetical protein
MCKLKIYLLLLALVSFSFAFDITKAPDMQKDVNPAIVSNKEDKGDPSEGELGIIATMAGVYNKGREAVKSVYDEIQYWKGIGATYDMLKDWYNVQKEKYKSIKRTVGKLQQNPKDVFAVKKGKDWFDTFLNISEAPLAFMGEYTGNAVSLVNKMDDFAYGGMRELDRIFTHSEKYVTLLGESKISGVLMPNTDEIYDKFDEVIYNSNMSDGYKKRIMREANYKRYSEGNFITLDSAEEARRREAQISALQEYAQHNDSIFSLARIDSFPETKIINTIKGLTASASGNSAMYYAWAMEAMDKLSGKMDTVDAMFERGEMDNIMDLQLLAAKLELEMINANNKRIQHELEALKIHHAMLGYEIWQHGKMKVLVEDVVGDALTLRQIALDALSDWQNKLESQ